MAEKLSDAELETLIGSVNLNLPLPLTELGVKRVLSALTELRELREKVKQFKQQGWFMTAYDGSLQYLYTDAHNPRDVHDNGRPYYRAYAVLAPSAGA